MNISSPQSWTLLVYKIPTQPTRLRLQVWRKLQAMGALYLHNAAWLLPAREDLVENMHYIAQSIEEMGGVCQLFSASALLPGGSEQIAEEFRMLADNRLEEIIENLDRIHGEIEALDDPAIAEKVDDALKRERVAYLRARRMTYFGSHREQELDERLDALRQRLDALYRGK